MKFKLCACDEIFFVPFIHAHHLHSDLFRFLQLFVKLSEWKKNEALFSKYVVEK